MENRVLAGLQDRVLREEFIEYVICGLQEELRQRHDALNVELKALGEEKHRIESELKGLVDNDRERVANCHGGDYGTRSENQSDHP